MVFFARTSRQHQLFCQYRFVSKWSFWHTGFKAREVKVHSARHTCSQQILSAMLFLTVTMNRKLKRFHCEHSSSSLLILHDEQFSKSNGTPPPVWVMPLNVLANTTVLNTQAAKNRFDWNRTPWTTRGLSRYNILLCGTFKGLLHIGMAYSVLKSSLWGL